MPQTSMELLLNYTGMGGDLGPYVIYTAFSGLLDQALCSKLYSSFQQTLLRMVRGKGILRICHFHCPFLWLVFVMVAKVYFRPRNFATSKNSILFRLKVNPVCDRYSAVLDDCQYITTFPLLFWEHTTLYPISYHKYAGHSSGGVEFSIGRESHNSICGNILKDCSLYSEGCLHLW